MKRARLAAAAVCLLWAVTPALAASDDQIRSLIIRESIAVYPGPCPCPYNTMRNGRACGRRSAYSRPGGYAPICYPADVTPAQIDAYRRSHGG
jgi:choline dehydrogenase-like flavoprotein